MIRGNIGYQPSSRQRCNNIANVPMTKTIGSNVNAVMTNPYEMSGEGIMDLARSILAKGKETGKYLQDVYTGNVGTALRNMLPDSDNTARPGFAGERHAILKLPNGKNGVANYMG